MSDRETRSSGPVHQRSWDALGTVRMRITLAAVAVTAAAVGLAGWALVRATEGTQLSSVRGELNAELDQVEARIEAGASPEDALTWPRVHNGISGTLVLEIITSDGQHKTFQILPDGETIGGDTADGSGTPAPAGEVQQTPSDGPLGDVEPAPPDDDDGGFGAGYAVPGAEAEPPDATLGGLVSRIETVERTVATPEGPVTIRASTGVGQVAGSVDFLRTALLIGLPFLVGLVGVITWILVGRALRQVEAIRAEVDAITETTMHRRVPEPRRTDEIGRLARTMNAMLGRLDQAAARQRQFVADASHELRSPVAAIKTRLEVARRNPDRADWPAVADTALIEEERLEGLLDDLLLLAAVDENGSESRATETVNVDALAHAEAERPRRVTVHVACESSSNGAAQVTGDPDRLTRVVGNLLDNAARYADTVVTLSVTPAKERGTVLLTVEDDGPGVPVADRERIFERFTRLDEGRTRDDGGAGLGLALVRSIVSGYHGQVWADDSPLGGARFTVELPLAWALKC